MDTNCINCGKNNCYAKGMCRSCYNKFIRSGFDNIDDFLVANNTINEMKKKRTMIEELSSVLKFTYADLGKICDVSREMVRRWFKNKYIPDKYVNTVYEYFINLARNAYDTLSDIE